MYVYMYVFIYVCIYIYICTYFYMNIFIMYGPMDIRIHVCFYVLCTYLCMYIRVYVFMHLCMYVCTHPILYALRTKVVVYRTVSASTTTQSPLIRISERRVHSRWTWLGVRITACRQHLSCLYEKSVTFAQPISVNLYLFRGLDKFATNFSLCKTIRMEISHRTSCFNILFVFPVDQPSLTGLYDTPWFPIVIYRHRPSTTFQVGSEIRDE